MVITLGAAVPELLGLIMTVPDRVSVELRVVGNGGLLVSDVFVGTPVQESQEVVLNGVTDGRDVGWVPDWVKFQEKGREWLEMMDCDTVGAVFHIVVVITLCPDDHELEVVLLNGGWLAVTVLVVPLTTVCDASADVEAAEVDAPPVVTVMITTVPAG